VTKKEKDALAAAEALFAGGTPIKVIHPFRHRGETEEQFRIRKETGQTDPAIAARLERERLEEGEAESKAS
jgi:hypothetical protein